jgi:hypothetical protein
MAHGIHPSIEQVESAVGDRPGDGASGITQRPGQLTNRDDPVLSLSKLRQVPSA